MVADINYIKNLISDYERDIEGQTFSFLLSDGVNIDLRIERKDVPHLMGIRKLPLRQAQNKSALAVYDMLKNGKITLAHIGQFKEEYKKVMNFASIISILHCGDAVKIVKRIGRIKSSYLFYLDHRPEKVIHLGVVFDGKDWHPESLLILQNRNVNSYLDGQIPVDIISTNIT